jgi:hypothetical protein
MSRIHANFKRFRDEDAADVLASLNTNKKIKINENREIENKLQKQNDLIIALQNDNNLMLNNYNTLLSNAIKNENILIQKIALRDRMICDIFHLIDKNIIDNTGPIPLKIKMANTYSHLKNPQAEHYFLKECKYVPAKN